MREKNEMRDSRERKERGSDNPLYPRTGAKVAPWPLTVAGGALPRVGRPPPKKREGKEGVLGW